MRVLIAVDLSEGADLGLREALSGPRSPEDSFGVVHVVPQLSSVSMLFPQRHAIEATAAPAIMARAAEAVRERVSRIGDHKPEVFVEEGVDYAQIVRRAEAWHADRIVVGSHGRSGIARLLGGTADHVVRGAGCSVLVARPSPAHGPVLAATDLSPASLHAVQVAAQEARRRGTTLVVVHAIGFLESEATYLLESNVGATVQRNPFESAAEALGEAMAKLQIEANCRVRDSPAAAAVIHEAGDVGAQLIVVGSHGHTGLLRLPTGDTAARVVHGAPCSVLVVKPDPDSRS